MAVINHVVLHYQPIGQEFKVSVKSNALDSQRFYAIL